MTPNEIISFWHDAGPERWFKADETFDADIRDRFESAWRDARDGKLNHWRLSVHGSLALLILLDQFPRNMFRGSPDAFSTDAAALDMSKTMIATGSDLKVDPLMRQFIYMPLMHSENPADQKHCVALFEASDDANNKKYAKIHADIIDRFGRFPHRNVILGRATTEQEAAFLDEGGFAG